MKELIHGLKKSEAYFHQTENVKVIQTAISCVFLTGDKAYKVCKPVNFGFLDFTTVEQRKEMCEKEVQFNKLLSPELYEDVVPVTLSKEGVGIAGEGQIIDYAIQMKQMDPESTMTMLLTNDSINSNHIIQLAQRVHSFHQQAPTSEEISIFGKIATIQGNWDENFKQTENVIDNIISLEDFSFIKNKINNFIQTNDTLFESRVSQGQVKHCHGDLHSGNIFVNDNQLLIFDGIVFNQRFPCSDVIADIAFMAMDLDFHEKKEFSKLFIEQYSQLSKDQDIEKLLNFYKCYRAYVRAKIDCFMYNDENVNNKETIKKEAQKYFLLSKNYAAEL